MPFLSADEALETLETGLRLVIKEVVGEDWVSQVKDAESLAGRVTTEEHQRDGVITSTDPIDYTMFYQLLGMIKSNWQKFQPVFLDQKRFEVWMKEADHVRNAIAHQRPLVNHEQDLISGISLQIRNLITLFRTRQMSSNEYYPVIESARDNFGRDGHSDDDIIYTKVKGDAPPIRIDVGQTVIVTCVGSDPRERDLEWICRPDFAFKPVEPDKG
ncbi:MAG TPA: Swt1 family HEPN domain-containing protein [Jatrophihabitans sp.]|jgi:hypothetical protein|uniref:Swt1 family HEPN domain-containing protein n=1 Tax=Jatrophihabitans sp. TaxID=1932789 RepID=UPI002EE7A4DE